MVAVGVGEHDRLNVVHGFPQLGQGRRELLVLARRPRIDDRDPAAIFDQPPVDQIGAEPIYAFEYFVDH